MSQGSRSIVVVGGGLAGLTAATFAARGGASVTLLEKGGALGGRAMTQERSDFLLNQGPHALYRGAAGIGILRTLGVEPRGGIPDASGGYAVYRGRLHALPGGPVSLLTTGLLPLGAKLELGRLLAGLRRIETTALDRTSVESWLARTVRHERARQLVGALFRVSTYANDPGRFSAGVAVHQLQRALAAGVLYLDGGWQTLVDALRRSAEAAGVRIVAGARVRAVEHDGQVRAVVCADGTRAPADAVVLAVDPAAAVELLGARAPALAAFARRTRPVRAACLDLCLTRLPRPRGTFALGVDRPLYLSVHSAVARLAPPGGALIHVAKYLSVDEDGADGDAEVECERLLDLVQPGWREIVAYRRFLPRMTVVNAAAAAEDGGLRGRPGVTVEALPGVFLAGDWVGSEGWLVDASLASARLAADRALALGHPARAA